MNSRLLLLGIVIISFFSLNAGDDQNKSEQPEWFTKFQQEYEANDKKKSDKWCAMFECLPKGVQQELIIQLTQKRIAFKMLGVYLYNETIETYTNYATPLILCKKHFLQNSLAFLAQQTLPSFSDEFEEESFKIMLVQLHQLSRIWFYPGWHVKQCLNALKNSLLN